MGWWLVVNLFVHFSTTLKMIFPNDIFLKGVETINHITVYIILYSDISFFIYYIYILTSYSHIVHLILCIYIYIDTSHWMVIINRSDKPLRQGASATSSGWKREGKTIPTEGRQEPLWGMAGWRWFPELGDVQVEHFRLVQVKGFHGIPLPSGNLNWQ